MLISLECFAKLTHVYAPVFKANLCPRNSSLSFPLLELPKLTSSAESYETIKSSELIRISTKDEVSSWLIGEFSRFSRALWSMGPVEYDTDPAHG